MINQVLISFKVDSSNLVQLDALCTELHIKRNHMLNFLVKYAVDSFPSYSMFVMMQSYQKALSEFKS